MSELALRTMLQDVSTEKGSHRMSTSLAVREPEVLEPGEPTLAELAETANREHRLVTDAADTMVLHAIRAGEALLAAQTQVAAGTGQWVKWLAANVDVTTQHAQLYMRLAEHSAVVLASDVTSITAAQRLLTRNGVGRTHWRQTPNVELRQEAKRLSREGLSYTAIAELLGTNAKTVGRWCDPTKRATYNRRQREWRAKRAAERRALRQQEHEQAIGRAVRQEGGALAEAYAMVSRLDQVLGQARQEANSKDRRLAVNEAHVLRDKMMEQILRALGVS